MGLVSPTGRDTFDLGVCPGSVPEVPNVGRYEESPSGVIIGGRISKAPTREGLGRKLSRELTPYVLRESLYQV